MPRKCGICLHEKRTEIDKALIAGEAYRSVAQRFNVSKPTLSRHRKNHVAGILAKAWQAKAAAQQCAEAQVEQETAHASELWAELVQAVKRVRLLFDACDQWLRDSADASRYSVAPRSEDIEVFYLEKVTDSEGKEKTVKRKSKLSELLARAKIGVGNDLEFSMIETKHADPRQLLLQAFAQLTRYVELMVELRTKVSNPPGEGLAGVEIKSMDDVLTLISKAVADVNALEGGSNRAHAYADVADAAAKAIQNADLQQRLEKIEQLLAERNL